MATVCCCNTNAVLHNRKLQVPVVWFFAESPGTKSRFHLLRIQLTAFICPYQSNDFVRNHRVQFGYSSLLQYQRCAA
ncbi:hypothetical protein T11_11364 [Trichinella zimbabwensis]|uniref:Uncharacterized protein n=1 Tax=Trichinella zimbabwensis TaxID=268475 RepID=A0A0V1GQS4_9BILA|nr:hypothetical protein T11_11364 [Trichinella zimbabwensis]